jgi:hypothetical protein
MSFWDLQWTGVLLIRSEKVLFGMSEGIVGRLGQSPGHFLFATGTLSTPSLF